MEIARIRYAYEDDLPDDISDEEYDQIFSLSKLVNGVRMYPYVNICIGTDSCLKIFLMDQSKVKLRKDYPTANTDRKAQG